MFDHVSARLRDERQLSGKPAVASPAPPGKPVPAGMSNGSAHNSIEFSDGGAERRRCPPRSALSAGSLLYLGFVGLVAGATIGAFFWAGFLFLAFPGSGAVAGFGSRDPTAQARAPVPRSLAPPTEGRPADGRFETVTATASLPNPAEAIVSSRAMPLTPRLLANNLSASAETSPAGREQPVETSMPEGETTGQLAAAPATAPTALAAPTTLAGPVPAPLSPDLSAADIARLLSHGDALLRTGDLASARLFYERAAAAGDGRAAVRLGATFDPAFLQSAGLGNLRGDVAEARLWYSRALDLGMGRAKRQWNNLNTKRER